MRKIDRVASRANYSENSNKSVTAAGGLFLDLLFSLALAFFAS
jgi:hypothetical protein